MNKKQTSLLIAYILGAFITNSYCRNCRWDDWVGPNWTEKRWVWKEGQQEMEDVEVESTGALAFSKTTGATILWPIYAASRACDAGVSYASNIELKWK